MTKKVESTVYVGNEYSDGIVNAYRNTNDSIFIIARAGCGKTTIIKSLAKMTPLNKRYLILAFNKHIADELEKAGFESRTTHSLGNSCIKTHLPKSYLEKDKLITVVKKYNGQYWSDILKYTGRIKGLGLDHNFDPEILFNIFKEDEVMQPRHQFLIPGKKTATYKDIIAYFNTHRNVNEYDMIERDFHNKIKNQSVVIQGIRDCLKYSKEKTNTYDFNDMSWLPKQLNLPMEKYDVLFVDESQDLNEMQIWYVINSLSPGGRVVMVGDDKQMIMGFNGATVDNLRSMQARLGAKEYLLPICYRCPKAVIDLAKRFVPDIQHFEPTGTGLATFQRYFDLSKLQPTDMVVARTNGEVISICMQLHEMGIPYRFKDNTLRAFFKDQLEFMKEHSESSNMYDTFGQYIQLKSGQMGKGLVTSIIELFKRDANASNSPDLESLTACVLEKYKSANRKGPTISTIHTVKGLEADRVILLDGDFFHFEGDVRFFGNIVIEETQEDLNLKYVAITRAKKELIMVANMHMPPK